MHKGDKFLKKTVMLHLWESKTDNLVLTTELKTLISDHLKEFKDWHFERQPFVRAIAD